MTLPVSKEIRNDTLETPRDMPVSEVPTLTADP